MLHASEALPVILEVAPKEKLAGGRRAQGCLIDDQPPQQLLSREPKIGEPILRKRVDDRRQDRCIDLRCRAASVVRNTAPAEKMLGREIEPRPKRPARKTFDQQARAEIDSPVNPCRVAHDIGIGGGAIDVLEQSICGGEAADEVLGKAGQLRCLQVMGIRNERDTEVRAGAALHGFVEFIGAGLPGEIARQIEDLGAGHVQAQVPSNPERNVFRDQRAFAGTRTGQLQHVPTARRALDQRRKAAARRQHAMNDGDGLGHITL